MTGKNRKYEQDERMAAEVEDTYCEAFEGLFVRLCVTAENEKWLSHAVRGATALPCTVFGESEAGIERFLSADKTPDGRVGAVVQIWVNGSTDESVERLENEVAKRVRQGILVVPTTAVYDAFHAECGGLPSLREKGTISTMRKIGHCGDGYEEVRVSHGREVIAIPIMMGEFIIEHFLRYGTGVMGGNIWLFCKSMDAALSAGERAVDAVNAVEGVIAPFGVCAAGSKPETKFPEIGPTTNHPFCPTLRGRITDSKVPDGVEAIPEIVVDGVSERAVENAIYAAIESVENMRGVLKISAGNYGGKLGKFRINLRR